MQIKMQTLCEWMQMGKDPVKSRMAPISGPKMMTKIAFPTMCQPNAAGSFSSDEYSLTVSVKLLSAIPRKNPAMQSHTIMLVTSVCSAKTKKRFFVKNCFQVPDARKIISTKSFFSSIRRDNSLDLVIATKRIETMNTRRFDTFVLSQIGGTMIRARMSVSAEMLKQYAVSALVYPRFARKKGVTILKFISAT